MQYRDVRFSRLRWLQMLVCVAGMIGAAILIGLGITDYGSPGRVWMIAAGGFVLFCSIIILTIVPLLLKMESTVRRQLNELRDLTEAISKNASLLETIAENTRISDTAKSLTHREEELAAIHGVIRDAIRNERWEHALHLVGEIEHRLGHKVEADQFRAELEEARTSAIQSKLTEAIELIESHFQSHEWGLAQSEIDRLKLALPGDPKVLALESRMPALKQEHKEELKKAWDEAVRRSDTDQAIDVLKELDQYLSPAEAETLRSSARDVFKEKLLQLSVQFRMAVTDKRWQDALSSGLELVRDFPRARMAGEVREVLDTLRERARQTGEVEAAGASTGS